MLLNLIQDFSTATDIHGIQLKHGYLVESSLNVTAQDTSIGLVIESTEVDAEDEADGCDIDQSYGIWFLLHLIDWVCVNLTSRQIEWCPIGKETSCIKYVEDEDYDINLDEMFDQAQRVIDCLLDSQETGLQKHHVTLHFLRHHILPQIRISQNDLDLVRKAFRMQEQHIAAIDADLEECNNTRTALKSTLSNLQHKIVPSLVKYSQVRHLYPAVTNSLSERLSAELLQLQGDTLTPKVKERSDEVVQQLESLKKSSKPPSKSWRKRHSGLLEELEDVFVVYEESDRHRKSWRLQEKMLLSAKVKATLIKEQLRGVEDQLSKASETLGYDIPSSHTKDSIRYSHSLYDSVLKLIQDVSHELGMRHLLQCNWIIETCKFTELLWTEQPHRIPSTSELFFPETSTEDGFTIINEAYVFSAISDRITAQCAYAVGQLLKLLPRMKPSPASTKRLVLTYETIIYKRVSEYIIPLFNLRYQKVLDQLCEDMQELSWEDLDIEEEWLLVLLNSRKSCDPDTSTHMLESVTSQLDSDKQAPVTTHDLSLSSSTSSQVVHSDTEKRLLDDVTLVSSSECHNNDEPDTLQTPVPDTLPNGTFYNDSGCHDVWPSPAISPHSSPRDENTSKLFPMQSPESRKCFTSSQRASLKLDLTSDVDVTDSIVGGATIVAGGRADNAVGGATNGAGGGDDDAVGRATIDTGGGADNAVGGATNGSGGGADNAVGGATNGAGGGADDAVEMTAELNDLLDSALSFLDEEDEALNRQFSSGEESKSEKKMRSRSADVAKLLSVEPSTPGVKRNRSKSAGAKARGRWNRVRGNVQGEGQMKSPSSPGAEATPAITPPSPSAAQRQDQTRRSVESILLKRRSRRPQSKRGPSTPTVSHKPIIADTRDNLFTEVFKDSIQCLIGMQSRCSPLEKAQLLAKCLRCISRTISELRSQDVATTAADDLVTVAIVMLMNVSLQQFRSIYVQLKFISTYMNSFMDAGIHSFACIQFIGAMHFIQDQILTKKYRQSSNSSKC